MRQKDKPWEKIGISRATWYRHDKPTEKPLRQTDADERVQQPRHWLNTFDCAADLMAENRKKRVPSMRTHQRVWRVIRSELRPWVEAGELSYAEADRWLSNPRTMRRFRKWLAEKEKEPPEE